MKKFLLALSILALPALMSAQNATDAYQFAQPDLKGTARFMSMGGAFGALGGDMTCLSYNPGGIGVYRNNDIGFTLDLDAQQSKGTSQGVSRTQSNTPFYLNNAGVIFTVRNQGALRNVNLGFTYNKTSSFNRRFRGVVPELNASISQYMAALANGGEATINDMTPTSTFNPYNPQDGGYQAPWASILGYSAHFIAPRNLSDGKVHWEGQFGDGTTGSGYYKVQDKGSQDEYNIAFGGNFNNILYWGMDFGIIDFSYQRKSMWGEDLNDAYVNIPDVYSGQTDSHTQLYNNYRVTGTGFNYKLGFILKPIQELRIGFAMHTPTWYSLEQSFYARAQGNYANNQYSYDKITNEGFDAIYDYRFRTPWRFIASIAGVLSNRFIISADYEWANYKYCHFTDKYSDEWLNGDPYEYTNSDIKDMYQSTNTLRIGVEARLSRNVSLRAGYALQSAPVKSEYRENQQEVYTDGARLDYTLDDRTYYITGGLGFHHKGFYTDLAYVYKNRQSEFHPFPADIKNADLCPSARITSANHQIVLTMGYKF